MKHYTPLNLSIKLATACYLCLLIFPFHITKAVEQDASIDPLTYPRATEHLAQKVEAAKSELIKHLRINHEKNKSEAVNNITVHYSAWVTWPDRSIGCPKTGESYPDVLTPGLLIILKNNGIEYRFHGDQNNRPFFCPGSQATEPYIKKSDTN